MNEIIVRDIFHSLINKSRAPTDPAVSMSMANDIFSEIVHELRYAILENHRIEIRGFGSFSYRTYGEYMGRNPKTGAKIRVTSKIRPFFKPGWELNQIINRKEEA